MDQATACLGRAGHAIQLDCRSLAYDYIPFNLPDTALIVCDSGVRHDLATSAYNERRHQCAEATVLLAQAAGRKDQIVALRDVTAQEFEQYGSVLPPILRRRARHVISENSRVHAAAAALRAGDVRQLGDLMNASHISLRDDYEVSSPELDALVAIATTLPGVWGARMMGAGFGGSIVALVSQEAIPALSATIAQEYPARTGHQATLYTVQVGGGPGIDGPA
jgi:galactokinase